MRNAGSSMLVDGGGFTGPTTAGRPILVCIVAIVCMTTIGLVGMITHSLPGDELIVILGLISGVGGFGAGAHLAAAERARTAMITRELLHAFEPRTQPAAPAET